MYYQRRHFLWYFVSFKRNIFFAFWRILLVIPKTNCVSVSRGFYLTYISVILEVTLLEIERNEVKPNLLSREQFHQIYSGFMIAHSHRYIGIVVVQYDVSLSFPSATLKLCFISFPISPTVSDQRIFLIVSDVKLIVLINKLYGKYNTF